MNIDGTQETHAEKAAIGTAKLFVELNAQGQPLLADKLRDIMIPALRDLGIEMEEQTIKFRDAPPQRSLFWKVKKK